MSHSKKKGIKPLISGISTNRSSQDKTQKLNFSKNLSNSNNKNQITTHEKIKSFINSNKSHPSAYLKNTQKIKDNNSKDNIKNLNIPKNKSKQKCLQEKGSQKSLQTSNYLLKTNFTERSKNEKNENFLNGGLKINRMDEKKSLNKLLKEQDVVRDFQLEESEKQTFDSLNTVFRTPEFKKTIIIDAEGNNNFHLFSSLDSCDKYNYGSKIDEIYNENDSSLFAKDINDSSILSDNDDNLNNNIIKTNKIMTDNNLKNELSINTPERNKDYNQQEECHKIIKILNSKVFQLKKNNNNTSTSMNNSNNEKKINFGKPKITKKYSEKIIDKDRIFVDHLNHIKNNKIEKNVDKFFMTMNHIKESTEKNINDYGAYKKNNNRIKIENRTISGISSKNTRKNLKINRVINSECKLNNDKSRNSNSKNSNLTFNTNKNISNSSFHKTNRKISKMNPVKNKTVINKIGSRNIKTSENTQNKNTKELIYQNNKIYGNNSFCESFIGEEFYQSLINNVTINNEFINNNYNNNFLPLFDENSNFIENEQKEKNDKNQMIKKIDIFNDLSKINFKNDDFPEKDLEKYNVEEKGNNKERKINPDLIHNKTLSKKLKDKKILDKNVNENTVIEKSGELCSIF